MVLRISFLLYTQYFDEIMVIMILVCPLNTCKIWNGMCVMTS